MIYSAAWLLTMDGPPISSGQMLVRGDQIEAVGTELRAMHPTEPFRDLGDAFLMPGFVNAHSHLDYTVLKGAADARPFAEWLPALAAFVLGASREQFRWSAMLGAAEMIRSGTTCVGDSTPRGESAAVVSEVGLRGVVYRETFDHADRMEQLGDCIADLQETVSDIVRVGVSPHSMYAQGPEVVSFCAGLAAEHKLPVMIHLSEMQSESAFSGQSRSPAACLAEMGALSDNWLLAHCVHCDEHDLEQIADSGAAIAHCPRSNCLLGAGIAPLTKMLEANVRVGLGTDSAASNLDLDLLQEARFAAALHRGRDQDASVLDCETVLRLATRGGAEALGLERVGCLKAGWAADFIAVRAAEDSTPMCDNPYVKLVFGGRADVVLSVVAGREIMADGRLLTVDEAGVRKGIKRLFGR